MKKTKKNTKNLEITKPESAMVVRRANVIFKEIRKGQSFTKLKESLDLREDVGTVVESLLSTPQLEQEFYRSKRTQAIVLWDELLEIKEQLLRQEISAPEARTAMQIIKEVASKQAPELYGDNKPREESGKQTLAQLIEAMAGKKPEGSAVTAVEKKG
jgi:hypothetical protein